MTLTKLTSTRACGLAALTGALAFAAFQVGAQSAPANGLLSLGDIESKLTAQGITIREVELRDRVGEVEGKDAQGVKVELLIDRKTGEILSNKPDR